MPLLPLHPETADMPGELNLIWKILLPAMQKGKLPANTAADATLKKKLAALALPVKKDAMAPSLTKAKTFVMEPNAQNIRSLSFNFQNNTCEVIIKRDTGIYPIRFAANNWQKGETTMKGPYLVSGARNSLAGLPPFKVASRTHLD
jgi:hypothetical protein